MQIDLLSDVFRLVKSLTDENERLNVYAQCEFQAIHSPMAPAFNLHSMNAHGTAVGLHRTGHHSPSGQFRKIDTAP